MKLIVFSLVALAAIAAPADAAFVTIDGGGNITGVFAAPQPQLPGYTTIADDDARLASFAAGGVPGSLAQKLAAGLAVTSTATPPLSATYALDPTTLDQVGSVARDAAAGLGLPGSASTFTYPDITGAPHVFASTDIQNLYKAMRDYVFALNETAATLQAGGGASWPSPSKTIP